MPILTELFNLEALSIIFLGLTITGLILGYKKEKIKRKKTKQGILLVILIIGILCVSYNYATQFINKKKLNANILELRTELQNSKNEIKRLTTRRTLDEKQKKAIIAEIEKYKGTKIIITYPADGSQENYQYVQCFINVFKTAGWVVNELDYYGGRFSNKGMKEINILLNGPYNEYIAGKVKAIENAFLKADLDYKFVVDPKQSNKAIILYICKAI